MRRLVVISVICVSVAGVVIAYLIVPDSSVALLVGGFWGLIAVGTVVRMVRAPRGERIRTAVTPFVGAAEIGQELQTGAPGVHKSLVNTAREQELRHTESHFESRQQ